MKYRKKPVVIDAVVWDGKRKTVKAIKSLTSNPAVLRVEGWFEGQPEPFLEIETLEGVMRANLGDYIIRGVKGELYPCKPDIFRATYAKVEP